MPEDSHLWNSLCSLRRGPRRAGLAAMGRGRGWSLTVGQQPLPTYRGQAGPVWKVACFPLPGALSSSWQGLSQAVAGMPGDPLIFSFQLSH